jgi:hypothetical protein
MRVLGMRIRAAIASPSKADPAAQVSFSAGILMPLLRAAILGRFEGLPDFMNGK